MPKNTPIGIVIKHHDSTSQTVWSHVDMQDGPVDPQMEFLCGSLAEASGAKFVSATYYDEKNRLSYTRANGPSVARSIGSLIDFIINL